MPEILYFEDFTIGQTFAFGSHALSADEIISFAREFDPQPQHIDLEAAQQGMLGGLVASGWQLCAIAMRMLVDGFYGPDSSLGSPGVEEVQWRRPVRPGDRLHMEAEVLGTQASMHRPDRGLVRFRFRMLRANENAADEMVMMTLTSALFRRRSA